MKRFLLALAFLFAAAPHASAQTISPVIVEFPEKADGRFQVFNDGDIPISVVVEPHSFSVDSTGKATFRKLDPGLHVELSTTSFRLGPKQAYYVFYKATSETFPNWFCIYATVTGPTTPNGLKLALELPHTVYLLGHGSLEQSQVSWTRAEIQKKGDKRLITAEVENHGTVFGRVEAMEVVSSTGKQTFGGFPLFPGQRREIELDWDQPGVPQQLVLKFPKFKLESGLKDAIVKQ